MDKSPITAVPVSENVKSDYDVSGSETEVNKAGFRARQREGVTFDTAGLDSHYKPIARYEGMHRYDPNFEWEPEEERRVVRKVCLFTVFYIRKVKLKESSD